MGSKLQIIWDDPSKLRCYLKCTFEMKFLPCSFTIGNKSCIHFLEFGWTLTHFQDRKINFENHWIYRILYLNNYLSISIKSHNVIWRKTWEVENLWRLWIFCVISFCRIVKLSSSPVPVNRNGSESFVTGTNSDLSNKLAASDKSSVLKIT